MIKKGPTLFVLAACILLTILTEVGGVILLLGLLVALLAKKRSRIARFGLFGGSFVCLWLASLFWLMPWLALQYNKVPLPMRASTEFPLRPVSILYPLLFRNYVTPALKHELQRVSLRIKTDTGQEMVYLDACFPLGKSIPLLPHLSHNDGRKMDLAFFYENQDRPTPPPSPLGYWAYVQPRKGDPQPCKDTFSLLRWDMDWLQPFFPKTELDEKKTRAMLRSLLQSKQIQKILLEPHLRMRMGLNDSRVRFQGCRAARHDDHAHVQVLP